MMQASPGGLLALAEEAADSDNVYAPDHVRPVEIRAADNAQLVQWVLQPAASAGERAGSDDGPGYRLMGGRLVATSHGPAAMFMYDDDHGERLVVLTRPMSTRIKMRRCLPQSKGDVAGFAWADGGMGYSLVGHSSGGIAAADRQRSPQADPSDLTIFLFVIPTPGSGHFLGPLRSLVAAPWCLKQ